MHISTKAHITVLLVGKESGFCRDIDDLNYSYLLGQGFLTLTISACGNFKHGVSEALNMKAFFVDRLERFLPSVRCCVHTMCLITLIHHSHIITQ